MTYSRNYDTSFAPSMPVIEVTLENTESGRRGEPLLAIVDSGADSCIIPQAQLDAIGSSPIRRSQMIGVSGVGQQVGVHLLIMPVGPITAFGIEVIADKRNAEAIVGRNVLNQFIVTLNGLASIVEVSS